MVIPQQPSPAAGGARWNKTFLRIVLITVSLLLFGTVSNCNAQNADRDETQREHDAATPDSAITYCLNDNIDRDRQGYQVLNKTATPTHDLSFHVVIDYQYTDTYRNVTVRHSKICDLTYGRIGWI